MPFGLSNTPAIFQGYVNKILAKKLNIFIIIYLDDIFIYTKDPGQSYVEVVHWVLDQLWKYCRFANLKKCCFHQNEICFLGYVVLSKGISMKAKQIEVVKKWPEPKVSTEYPSFSRLCQFLLAIYSRLQ